MGNRSKIITVRLSPENMRAAELVAALTSRTMSSLADHAIGLYIQKNYPDALNPSATVALKLDEAPEEKSRP